MNSLDLVRSYFDRAARRFDAIYEGEKPLSQRVVDTLFRQVVLERFRLICNLAPLPGQWTVLDVGCGPGRYAVALAQAGAAHVTGVDMSQSMIALARAEAETRGVAARCAFHTSAFLEWQTERRFDIGVATGYFDYLPDPAQDLRKMTSLCVARIFASFPKRWEVRVPLRRLRFALAGGFVRFYGRDEVIDLFAAAGIARERLSLVDLGRDWIAVARLT
jgi:2-polyprenyl-3-methyl-5-hydroxy-6-metoxy-1,4-benzoquinol methylase